MDAFEYLSVLISIVLGLGITQLLSGFSRWLEHRRTFRPYGPAIAWAAFLLLVHVQTWWSMYGLRYYAEWSFIQFSFVLLQPIVLFLLSSIVFPGSSVSEHDLRSNFHNQRPWFFGLLVALVFVSLVKDLVRQGGLPDLLNLGFHGVLLAVSGGGLMARRDRTQAILAYATLSLFLAYIAVLFAEL